MPEAPVTGYSSTEIMTIEAARRLKNGTVCFVGIGMPSAAANLARLTHAPELVLIYESGTIGTRPTVLPLSIGDGELAEHRDRCSRSRDLPYFSRAGAWTWASSAPRRWQVRHINTTVIGGDYAKPKGALRRGRRA